MQITIEQLSFILNEIILSGYKLPNNFIFEVEQCDEKFTISVDGNYYDEKNFDFIVPQLFSSEYHQLLQMMLEIKSWNRNIQTLLKKFDSYAFECNFFFKAILFFTGEFYLKKPIQLDQHNRVTEASVAEEYRQFLDVPIVDILCACLLKKLKCVFPIERQLLFTSDYDIVDWKAVFNMKRMLRRSLRSLSQGNVTRFFKEWFYFFFGQQWIKQNPLLNTKMFWKQKSETLILPPNTTIRNIAFMLVEYYNQMHDYPNNYSSKSVRSFLRKLVESKIELGLHPSYSTFDNPSIIHDQCKKFNEIFDRKVKLNRFHFLRFQIPHSLKLLDDSEIEEDYSLYIVDSLAFRCGISKPFRVWNYENNRPFKTILTPITLMDCTFDMYRNLDFETALKFAQQKVLYALAFGTSTVLLWHNTYFYKRFYKMNYQIELFNELSFFLQKMLTDLSAYENGKDQESLLNATLDDGRLEV